MLEQRGLRWLQKKVINSELSICEADKGGAILIVQPDMLEKKIEEKVLNPNLYEKLEEDPRSALYDSLIDVWKKGKANSFVSEVEAKAIVGITEFDNKSTASRFKPGQTYFVPSLKIHKLKPEDIKPGCNIPARLITCLQEGVTKRSDVFIADKWLKQLEKDYCKDLVKDTTESLIWLEELNTKAQQSSVHFSPFTFDFDSLYDRLSPDLVFEALKDAMNICRPTWDERFKTWLLDLVELSIESSVGIFREKFYKPKGGLPTGGSLSVEAANITVFFALKQVLYSDPKLMKNIVDIKRFVDDGTGVHIMTKRVFNGWKKTVSERVAGFGLKIKETDWNEPEEKHGPVNFLDISFKFDSNKHLQTDLYIKPTDARSYLNFSSAHPNYTFSGIVYSQAVRIRRIVNDDTRFANRLNELFVDFRKCGYPQTLLTKIMEKVRSEERCLIKKDAEQPPGDDKIIVISTFGRDKKLTDVVEKVQSEKLKFQFVKKQPRHLKIYWSNQNLLHLGLLWD